MDPFGGFDPFDPNNPFNPIHPNNDENEWEIIEAVVHTIGSATVMQNSRQHSRQRIHIERNREEGHIRLYNDYFYDNPVYTKAQFRRRFRMRKEVFLCIVEALSNHDEYFQVKVDATGRKSLSPPQKCAAAICILAYGSPANSIDDYIRIGEATAIKCLERFVKGVNEVFGPEYLRRPNTNDTERLLQMGEARGFLGMLGSIDCIHWEWKNFPVAWQGQFVEVIMLSLLLYLKQWHYKICGFGMHFLELQVQTTILTS